MTICKIIVQRMPVPIGTRRWVDWISPVASFDARKPVGAALAVSACVLAVGFIIFAIGISVALDFGKVVGRILICVICIPLLLSLRFARRLRAPHALAVLRGDGRPPLLLLRAFRDDYYPLQGFTPEERSWITGTFEEYLHRKLSPCGPVIAIGRPGEKIPPLGAPRFWVPDDKWKAVIQELLGEAQYVLMVMGNLATLQANSPADQSAEEAVPAGSLTEDGLTWEVRQVFALHDLRRVILLMPPVNESEAQSRWEQYRTLSGHRFPPYQGGELAVVFDAHGQGRVLCAPDTASFSSRKHARFRDWAAYEACLEVRDTDIPSGLQWLETTVPPKALPKSVRQKAFAILRAFLGYLSAFSFLLVLCLFMYVMFFAADTPEGLAKEKLDAWISIITAKGNLSKTRVAEAKLNSINERVGKLSSEDKKKFDAADQVERMRKTATEWALERTLERRNERADMMDRAGDDRSAVSRRGDH